MDLGAADRGAEAGLFVERWMTGLTGFTVFGGTTFGCTHLCGAEFIDGALAIVLAGFACKTFGTCGRYTGGAARGAIVRFDEVLG